MADSAWSCASEWVSALRVGCSNTPARYALPLMLMSASLLSPGGYHGEVAAEERAHLLEAVGPCLGASARRRAAAARRARIDARRDVAHGVGAVERVMRAGIDLERQGIAGLHRALDERAAGLGGRPVVLVADEDQQRCARPVDAERARERRAPRIERDARGEARARVRAHRGERAAPAVRAAHDPDPATIHVGPLAELGERREGVERAAIGAHVG